MKQILYFYGEDCHQCKALKPKFEAEVKRLGFTNYSFVNAEDEKNERLVAHYRLRSIPVLIFLDNGEEIGRAIGAGAWERIKDFVL